MSDDDVEIDYAYLTQNALRGVVRDALELTVSLGHPPGEHHFYIEFATHGRGVNIASFLKEQYPDRMTIVLQHQFQHLTVREDGFSVTLHFNNVPEHLEIPFSAVTQFADPSVQFALQFPVEPETGLEHLGENADENVSEIDPSKRAQPKDDDPDPDDSGPSGGSADVVSLDRFRKK